MKKVIAVAFSIFCFASFAFSQANISIDVEDEIYTIIDNAYMRGLCSSVNGAKPWTENKIRLIINEILENEDKLSKTEVKVLEQFIEAHTVDYDSKKDLRSIYVSNGSETNPISFLYDFSFSGEGSGGFYTNDYFNGGGFDFFPLFNFEGDLTKYISYRMSGKFDISYIPLTKMGTYNIGYAWYDDGVEEYLDGKLYSIDDPEKHSLSKDETGYYYVSGGVKNHVEDGKVTQYEQPRVRTVEKLLNTAHLPFGYKKRWNGQFYQLSNLSASGTEGWASKPGFSGTIEAEIRTTFLDQKISVGAGRYSREWAAMDRGSSLVYNMQAQPFLAFDTTFEIFPWLKFSSLCGILEYPNQDYMNENSYAEEKSGIDDSYFYQNGFSMNLIELDFKYLHFDIGSTVVFPKRFEIGYVFPLLNYVEYQNHIGDCDNLALYGNIKVQKPGLGSIWASLYLDEINGLNNDPFTSSRAMFAGQLGVKAVFPWIGFGSVSMRYTKVEPYCYTHHSINYAPSYSHYVSENYTNNGDSLGYYLPPNSDELLFRLEGKPSENISASLNYQFVRHGADYGSQQVPGSSLYSELPIYNRDELKKYFLRDGAYNWMHIVSIGGQIENRKAKVPVALYANVGFIYSYWTMIDDSVYSKRNEYGSNGNSRADKYTSFHFVDNDEYPVQCGAVITAGIKLWKW